MRDLMFEEGDLIRVNGEFFKFVGLYGEELFKVEGTGTELRGYHYAVSPRTLEPKW